MMIVFTVIILLLEIWTLRNAIVKTQVQRQDDLDKTIYSLNSTQRGFASFTTWFMVFVYVTYLCITAFQLHSAIPFMFATLAVADVIWSGLRTDMAFVGRIKYTYYPKLYTFMVGILTITYCVVYLVHLVW